VEKKGEVERRRRRRSRRRRRRRWKITRRETTRYSRWQKKN
jgi:hypothetical protein